MHTIYLGKWNNYDSDCNERLKELNEVIEAVEKHSSVRVSFNYDGRTAHEIAAYEMKRMLPKNYKTIIGYNYEFTIEK